MFHGFDAVMAKREKICDHGEAERRDDDSLIPVMLPPVRVQ